MYRRARQLFSAVQFVTLREQTPFRGMACENLVVTVKQGKLRGVKDKNVFDEPYLAFRGIPYAKPPVGSLRFKDPQPPEPWTGIREANVCGSSATQFNQFIHELEGSEDCLYLNVYTPSIETSSRRAVMVWIHGGGFIVGSGDSTFYAPDYLIRKDIVLVTINYRLGVFGFLNANHKVAAGNQGLKDQATALKWVRENVLSFGGDPENVTIFGESAGSASVHYLTISPLARGLFDKAIAQSGVASNPWALISDEPRKHVINLAAILGKDSKDPEELVQFLQTVETADLLAAAKKLVPREMNHIVFTCFGPTVDSASPAPFVPQHPSELQKLGIRVPLLLGYNACEGSIFVSSMFMPAFKEDNVDAVYDRLNRNPDMMIHPEIQQEMKREGLSPQDLKRLYFGDRPVSRDTSRNYVELMSDMMFVRGILNVAKVQTETKAAPTYLYKFSYEDEHSFAKIGVSGGLKETGHGDDIIYLFHSNMLMQLGVEPVVPGSVKHRISEYFTQMWTDFAKTGNPTPMTTSLIQTIWRPVEKGEAFNYLNINETLKMETTKPEEHTFDWKKMKKENKVFYERLTRKL